MSNSSTEIRIVSDGPKASNYYFYVIDGDVRIDISEFVMGFEIISEPSSRDETVRVALKLKGIELNILAEKVVDKMFYDYLVSAINERSKNS